MNLLMAEHFHFRSLARLSAHHLAEGLATRGHRVTYISACFSPLHLLTLFGKSRSGTFRRFANWIRGGETEFGELLHYVPLTLTPVTDQWPFNTPFFADCYLRLCLPSLASLARKRGPFDAIVITDLRFIPLRQMFPTTPFVVRLVDDMTAFNGIPRPVIDQLPKALEEADLIVTTAHNIKARLDKQGLATPIAVVPNGAALERFGRDIAMPNDMKAIPGPRLIYLGAFEEWFDLGIIEEIADKLPEASIVLVGPSSIDLSGLERRANVHYLGPKPYAQVAAYCRASDIGIIPFKQTRLVDSICPIKMFEYMAAGLPVVATSWQELRLFESPVRLVDRKEDWPAAISSILEAPVDAALYSDYAKKNAWDARVSTFEQALSGLCVERSSKSQTGY